MAISKNIKADTEKQGRGEIIGGVLKDK